jgi:hypothetical protein
MGYRIKGVKILQYSLIKQIIILSMYLEMGSILALEFIH